MRKRTVPCGAVPSRLVPRNQSFYLRSNKIAKEEAMKAPFGYADIAYLLKHCPGGSLNALRQMREVFLDEGPVILNKVVLFLIEMTFLHDFVIAHFIDLFQMIADYALAAKVGSCRISISALRQIGHFKHPFKLKKGRLPVPK